MYNIKYTGHFKKSLKRCIKRGYHIEDFRTVYNLLEATGKLPAEFRPHILSGDYDGYWECHINSDWLLIWWQNDKDLILTFSYTGTHSDLY